MQLFALVKCILSLSHRNAVPERGLSINKKLLGIHGTATYKDTILAQRLSSKQFQIARILLYKKLVYKKSSSKGSFKN